MNESNGQTEPPRQSDVDAAVLDRIARAWRDRKLTRPSYPEDVRVGRVLAEALDALSLPPPEAP